METCKLVPDRAAEVSRGAFCCRCCFSFVSNANDSSPICEREGAAALLLGGSALWLRGDGRGDDILLLDPIPLREGALKMLDCDGGDDADDDDGEDVAVAEAESSIAADEEEEEEAEQNEEEEEDKDEEEEGEEDTSDVSVATKAPFFGLSSTRGGDRAESEAERFLPKGVALLLMPLRE